MAEGIEAVPAQAGRSLAHKLGPLPVWAWIVLGVGGAAGAYYLLVGRNASSNGSGGGAVSLLPSFGAPAGNDGAPSSSNTSPLPAPLAATSARIQSAISQAASSLGFSTAQAQLYWDEYAAGNAPVGSSQATGAFAALVNSVNTILGASAPAAPTVQSVNANPFSNNTSWLDQLLGFIPSGTAPADINNIIAWVNGQTTTLSQTAANALTAAQGIVGTAPNPLGYTIAGTPSTTPGAPSGGVAGLTQAAINAWDNTYLTLPSVQQNFQAWIASAPAAITQTFDTGTLQSVYNYFNSASGKAAVASAGGPLGFWNSYATNPTSLIPVPVLTPGVTKK